MSKIPPDILAEIKTAAKDSWPNDHDMQVYEINSETEAYRSIEDMDFGYASPFRDRIIKWANEVFSEWEGRVGFIQTEIDSFAMIQERPDDVPPVVFDELKQKAAIDEEYFSSQLNVIQGGVAHYRYVRDTREKITPIRELLVRMEAIIGDECYNDNIQNYGSWGVWEGEGRSFRYPVTVLRDGQSEKRRSRFDDLLAEELVTGHYKFGANELSIYRALVKVIDMLEAEYGLKLPRSK